MTAKDSVRVCLGGTFDPVHNGHIGSALALADYLCITVTLVPNGNPAHRDRPKASSVERLAMLRLACDNDPRLCVDAREVDRQGPSYTIDSLREIRQDIGAKAPLIWCLGVDAFAHLTSWNEWHNILHEAHLLVLQRPGVVWPQDIILRSWWRQHAIKEPILLLESNKGRVATIRLPSFAVSATAARCALQNNTRLAASMLPPVITQYISTHGLYGVKKI